MSSCNWSGIDLDTKQRKPNMVKYGSWRLVIKHLRDVHVPERMEQQRVPGNVQSPCCSMGWGSCHIEKDNENDHWEGHQHWWTLRIDADGSRLGVELGDCIPGSQQIWNRKIPSGLTVRSSHIKDSGPLRRKGGRNSLGPECISGAWPTEPKDLKSR